MIQLNTILRADLVPDSKKLRRIGFKYFDPELFMDQEEFLYVDVPGRFISLNFAKCIWKDFPPNWMTPKTQSEL